MNLGKYIRDVVLVFCLASLFDCFSNGFSLETIQGRGLTNLFLALIIAAAFGLMDAYRKSK